jgi:hypothetical protein
MRALEYHAHIHTYLLSLSRERERSERRKRTKEVGARPLDAFSTNPTTSFTSITASFEKMHSTTSFGREQEVGARCSLYKSSLSSLAAETESSFGCLFNYDIECLIGRGPSLLL